MKRKSDLRRYALIGSCVWRESAYRFVSEWWCGLPGERDKDAENHPNTGVAPLFDLPKL